LAGVLVQEAPLRHPKSVAGAGDNAATGPLFFAPATCYYWPWCACQSVFRELGSLLLLTLLSHTHWQASWCPGPYCAVHNKLLELELILLLDFSPPP